MTSDEALKKQRNYSIYRKNTAAGPLQSHPACRPKKTKQPLWKQLRYEFQVKLTVV